MILHPLHTDILPPEEMNNPFDYEPHPLCLLAAEELQRHISQQSPEWLEEVNRGKMFGVLVAQPLPRGREANQLDSSATKTNPQSGNTHLPLGGVGDGLLFLAAYSGQICGRSDWDYFVPAVFDYLQPDGYFKTHEAEITQINHEIAVVSTNEERQRLRKQYHNKQLEAEQAIKKYSLFMTGAKMLRDQQRKNSFLSENDKEQLIRESQFQKAQLKRIKKQYAEELQAIERQLAVYNNHLNTLEHQRKEKSRALQQWLFDNFKLLNHKGETRSLQELFADTVFGEPPSGAGECCEPKLLHYAYTHNLRPLCMAMFWWGDSPKSEVRHHLHYYPACSGKCKPILSWMMAQPQQEGKEAHPQPFPKGRESNCSTSTVSKTNPRSGSVPLPSGGVRGRLPYGYEMADPITYSLLKEFANKNRQKPTEAESFLWDQLKGNFFGCHFRRQHIIGPFITDFACLKKKLIIELDGGYHQLPEQQTSDKERTEWLESKGFKVLRFTNEEVTYNTQRVLESIKTYIIKEHDINHS